MSGEEPTQATQGVLDPRREGKQNSGFSDDDISDIICVLHPYSQSARAELQRLANENHPYIIGRSEVDRVEPDYEAEDHASRFDSNPAGHGNHAIILRLSSDLNDPAAGFGFGRNGAKCDVVFIDDPCRRISNVHFRIYVNQHGNVMIEDKSTNGTSVDRHLLTSHPKDPTQQPVTRWVLSSGSLITIFLHQRPNDLIFRVRIPKRDDDYDRAYAAKVDDFFTLHNLHGTAVAAPPLPPTGPPDIFRAPGELMQNRRGDHGMVANHQPRLNQSNRRDVRNNIPREWNGSGKYNRIGKLGKGAFAVVYKVTSKYDGNPYAAKELEKRRFVKNGVLDQKVENEMKIMQRVHHPNIVRYVETFDWEDRLLIIIMEYVPCGDLGKFIMEEGAITEYTAQIMSKQLLSALGYLHANNITHRDVKPDNILIQSYEPFEVKLTDFGLSKMVDTEQTFLRTFCGTLLYCAPEVYTEYIEYDDNGIRNRGQRPRRPPGQRYNHAVDIWSLGGVIFYTMTTAPPYPVESGISYSELLHRIMTTNLNLAPLQRRGVSEYGIDFLVRMLQRKPENRASILELDNHLWFGGPSSEINASQSYDEITDDEDMFNCAQPEDYEDDRISDSIGNESEKENDGMNAQENHPQPQRLFGEIGASVIGSSGVIPNDFLDRPAIFQDNQRNQFAVSRGGNESYDSGIETPPATHTLRQFERPAISLFQQQSTDQLQSLVDDVASQSLGGNDGGLQPGASSYYSSFDFNTSKRKPPSNENSDEFEETLSPHKPQIKRLKSEGNLDEMSESTIEEYKLLACMPQIRRLGSGRQIDGPVSKVVYWEQDRSSWHMSYPEMTQLQHDAFAQAARERSEDFAPGKTPLWDLALKHFPPSTKSVDYNGNNNHRVALPIGFKRDDGRFGEANEFPSTAVPGDNEPIPDTLPHHIGSAVPIQADGSHTRPAGFIESHPQSCVPGVSFAITDSLVSFGRGPINTQVFEPVTEPRVPKYAFKILLWKEGYDPSKDPSKQQLPWLLEPSGDEDSYSFWISTKATLGIRINKQDLPSHEAKNPTGPSCHWSRLHDGDILTIWGARDVGVQTSLIFRCTWGASSKPRRDWSQPIEFASQDTSRELDLACQRTEKRIRSVKEKNARVNEAMADLLDRQRLVEKERDRSRRFEEKRLEAVGFLQTRMQNSSWRGSTVSLPVTRNGLM